MAHHIYPYIHHRYIRIRYCMLLFRFSKKRCSILFYIIYLQVFGQLLGFPEKIPKIPVATLGHLKRWTRRLFCFLSIGGDPRISGRPHWLWDDDWGPYDSGNRTISGCCYNSRCGQMVFHPKCKPKWQHHENISLLVKASALTAAQVHPFENSCTSGSLKSRALTEAMAWGDAVVTRFRNRVGPLSWFVKPIFYGARLQKMGSLGFQTCILCTNESL